MKKITKPANRACVTRQNTKAIMEAYNKASKKLAKKLNEDGTAINDMIAPALAAMDKVAELKASGAIPEIPYEELVQGNIEFQTSEDELDQETGLDEAALRERGYRLQEVAGGKPALRAYLADGGNPESYEDFIDWCATQGTDTTGMKRGWFNTSIKQIQGGRSPVTANEEPETPKEPYIPSASLQSMIDACAAGEDYVETAADTVATKYKMIERKLKRVIAGKSEKNYYLLFGDAGIGKSVIVKQTLEKMGWTVLKGASSNPGAGEVEIVKGDMGSSRTDVARFLWKYKDRELVVLDDCDSMIDKKTSKGAVANMLKGALDKDSHVVTISPSIMKSANNLVQDEAAKIGRNNKLFEDAVDDQMDGMYDGDDDLEDYEAPGEDGMLDTNPDIITEPSWTFNARVIFISNLDTPDIVPAVLSRCDYFCLHLTQEEYLVRLAMIIDDMKFDTEKSGWSDEWIKVAKGVAVTMMSNVIEAANNHVKLFNKVVTLSHPLEFRIITDLVENYLILCEEDMEENGSSFEEAGSNILPEFVKTVLIPRI